MVRYIVALMLALLATPALAQPVSQLPPAATPLTGAEVFPVVQGGVTKKATVSSVRSQGTIEIADYCTTTQIATDITTCGQAAINAAQALANGSYGGAIVHLPARYSPYQLASGTLAITASFVSLVGDAEQGTFINCLNGSVDCIKIGAIGGANIRDNAIKDLSVWSDGSKTGGAAVHVVNTYNTLIQRADFSSVKRGIDVDQQNNGTTLRDVTIILSSGAGTSDYGIYWHAPADNTLRNDVLALYNVTVEGGWSDATTFLWDGMANTTVGSSIRLLHAKYGVRVINSAASATLFPSFMNWHDLEAEGFKSRAVSIEAGSGFKIINSDINNLTGGAGQGGADDYAFAVLNDVTHSITRVVQLSNSRVGASQRAGLYTEGRDVQLSNVTFFSTSMAGVGTYPVISVAATAIGTMLHNIVCEEFGGAARAGRCLDIASGATITQVANVDYSYVNTTPWWNDPGNSLTWNAPAGGFGKYRPTVDGANAGLRVDKSTDATFLVSNGSTGASVEARYQQATGTANSYYIDSLLDNGGSPVHITSSGSAVTADRHDAPIHIWRSAAGVEYGRIDSSALKLGTSIGIQMNGTPGVSCSGTPSVSFATVNGIVTHC